MLKAITGMFRTSPYERPAQLLYKKLVDQARTPIFYADWQVPDTVDGRFDMIAIHLFLVLDRLEVDPQDTQDTAQPAQALGQRLVDHLVSDMDRSLREMGVGDLSVGKKVQKMARALYGRLEAYQVARTTDPDGAALEMALCRNLYRAEEAEGLPLAQMKDYVETQISHLAELPFENLLAGNISFAKVEA